MPFVAWTSYGWMDVSLLLELEGRVGVGSTNNNHGQQGQARCLGPFKAVPSTRTAQCTTKTNFERHQDTKSLRLSHAFRNDRFGARYDVANLERVRNGQRSFYRHFAKDYLPRIRYANPTLNIQVEKARKTPQEAWRPAMEVEFSMPFPCGIHAPLFN